MEESLSNPRVMSIDFSDSKNSNGSLYKTRNFCSDPVVSLIPCKVKTVADQRIDLRKLNLNPVRATEKDLALRDSSLKKNTAFVRKIVSVWRWSAVLIIRDTPLPCRGKFPVIWAEGCGSSCCQERPSISSSLSSSAKENVQWSTARFCVEWHQITELVEVHFGDLPSHRRGEIQTQRCQFPRSGEW